MTTGRKPVVGLIGGVGSGKSTVAAELVALGCAVIDADRIGHDLLADPAVQEQFRRLWGPKVFSPAGEIDRQAVGKIVFDDPAALASLNQIMHPRIRQRIIDLIDQFQGREGVPAIVLDAALLLETDWHELCSVLVYVSAPDQARQERVAQARGWDGRRWRQRENSQKALDIKAARADYIVDNSSSVSCLCEQVRSVFQRIISQANRF